MQLKGILSFFKKWQYHSWEKASATFSLENWIYCSCKSFFHFLLWENRKETSLLWFCKRFKRSHPHFWFRSNYRYLFPFSWGIWKKCYTVILVRFNYLISQSPGIDSQFVAGECCKKSPERIPYSSAQLFTTWGKWLFSRGCNIS